MNEKLREDALHIIREAVASVMPGEGVAKGLEGVTFPGKVYVVSVGKAAWTMARSAAEILGDVLEGGIILTKYDHSQGELEGFDIFEAGHPLPDGNSIRATSRIISYVKELKKVDTVLFLLSGGGSSLFEKPLPGIALEDIVLLTEKLLASGADIVEINTVRKRLSSVKAGRFAKMVNPASVFTIVLSDVVGDRLDFIASGPAVPDSSTREEAFEILDRYSIQLSDNIRDALNIETPKSLSNVKTLVTGNVEALCKAAEKSARQRGYKTLVLTTSLNCEAREAGRFLAAIAREERSSNRPLDSPCVIIAGGETVVNLKGSGKGGRNQEIVLSAALGIKDLDNIVIASAGSDGTDGPTDAAGGIVDGFSISKIERGGISPEKSLRDNDSYNALAVSGDLLITGPTGTNVNDVALILCGIEDV